MRLFGSFKIFLIASCLSGSSCFQYHDLLEYSILFTVVEGRGVTRVKENSEIFENIPNIHERNANAASSGFHISDSSIIRFTIDDVIQGPEKQANTKQNNKINKVTSPLKPVHQQEDVSYKKIVQNSVSKPDQSAEIIKFVAVDSSLKKPVELNQNFKNQRKNSPSHSKSIEEPEVSQIPEIFSNLEVFFEPTNVFPSEEIIDLVGSTQISSRPTRKAQPQHHHFGR